MQAILRAAALDVRFGGLHALKAVDLSVMPGEIVGLLGPNGAGKTTLFNAVAGAIKATSGDLSYEGATLGARSPSWRARNGIARTFQITQPFPALTVAENVIVGAMLHGGPFSRLVQQADEIISYVGLSEKRAERADRLSTGQRKRLELARALATRPKLLLMDEVTGGVDQPSIPGLMELVLKLNQDGLTVVIIEHKTKVLAQICDRLVFLHRGEKLVEGAPEAVLGDERVARLYLGEA